MLCLIVARAANGVIGANNALPWKLPEDLQYFKRTTLGCPIIMGRKTWDSIGRPLPGRRNIVVTRNPAWEAVGAERAASVAQATGMVASAERAFVIGGSELYAQALPLISRAYVTEIDQNFDGDATFPALCAPLWQEVSRQPQPRSKASDVAGDNEGSSAGGFDYAFVIYEKQLGA